MIPLSAAFFYFLTIQHTGAPRLSAPLVPGGQSQSPLLPLSMSLSMSMSLFSSHSEDRPAARARGTEQTAATS